MSIFNRALRTFDAAALNASAQNIGNPIPFVTYQVSIINTSDVDVLIDDGTGRDDIRVPSQSTVNISSDFRGAGQVNEPVHVFSNQAQLTITQVTGAGTGTIILNIFGV
ncbi:MAG: hypothetical protein PVI43_01270 [Candidatus Bathyarchaeota archaeon]|jgi:hypothetical protein